MDFDGNLTYFEWLCAKSDYEAIKKKKWKTVVRKREQ